MLVSGVLPSLREGTIVEGIGDGDETELAILRIEDKKLVSFKNAPFSLSTTVCSLKLSCRK